MTVTILAVVFLAVMGVVTAFGFRLFRKPEGGTMGANEERCSICGRQFEKSLLLERTIGDYRVYRFCRDCILGLYSDLGLKN